MPNRYASICRDYTIIFSICQGPQQKMYLPWFLGKCSTNIIMPKKPRHLADGNAKS